MSKSVRMPIQTIREGNKITKICVEDYYKMVNRIIDAEVRSAEKWNELLDSIEKEVEDANGNVVSGCLVTGTGVSQPNIKDTFDEKIGNNIAFMKAKLNANMKKRNLLLKLWDICMITPDAIDEEIAKIDELIKMDLTGMRKHNPDYLNYLDEYGYEYILEDDEIQEEDC